MKGLNVKKSLAFGLAVVMMVAAAGCGTEKPGDSNVADKEKPVLKVGTSADYPPYEFHTMVDGKDQIVGADIELTKLIADKLGMEMKLTDMSFDGLLGSLASNKFDMVIAGLTNDPERKVLFSENYTSREQTIMIQKKDEDKYQSVKDLQGKKVAGQIGTIQDTLAQQFAGKTALAIQQYPDMIMMLKSGKIDAMISDSDVAQIYIQANPDLVAAKIDVEYGNPGVAIAFNLNNQELCDKVNTVLDELKKDGTVDKLMKEATAQAAKDEKANAEKSAQ